MRAIERWQLSSSINASPAQLLSYLESPSSMLISQPASDMDVTNELSTVGPTTLFKSIDGIGYEHNFADLLLSLAPCHLTALSGPVIALLLAEHRRLIDASTSAQFSQVATSQLQMAELLPFSYRLKLFLTVVLSQLTLGFYSFIDFEVFYLFE